MEQRLEWLDSTRGIAILLVVFAHTLDYFWKGYTEIVQIGNAGVVLFFACSGYLIPMSLDRLSVRDFWVRRFFRLFPAYWVCIALMVCLGVADFTAGEVVIANITMLHGYMGLPDVSGIFWSLTVEIGFYLLMTVLRLFRIHTYTLELFVALTLLTAILQFFHAPYMTIWVYLPVFLFGAVCYRYNSGKYSFRQVVLTLLATSVYLLYASAGWNWRIGWLIAVGLFVCCFWYRAHQSPRWLVWCGMVSYSVYLFHLIPLKLSQGYAVPVIFMLAALGYYFIERPSTAIGRRLTARPRLAKVVFPDAEPAK